MENEQMTKFQRESYEFHTENLSEELCKGLCFLLKQHGSEEAFEENFPSLCNQRRMYDGIFKVGDSVKTAHGLEGVICKISEDKPHQKISIRLEEYLIVDNISIITVPSQLVKMAFDITDFSDEINPF